MRGKAAILFVTLCVLVGAMLAQDQPQPSTASPPGIGMGGMQRGRGAPADVERHLAMLNRRFNLTDEQKQQIRPMLQDAQEQARSIRQDTALTPEQRVTKLRELRQGLHSRIVAILTPEQRAMKGRKGHGWHRAEARLDPQRRLANLDRRVKLTDEQKAKLLPIFEQEKQQLQAEASKMHEIHRATHEQVLSVLTPEQQQALRPIQPDNSK